MSPFIILHGVRTVNLTKGQNTLVDECDWIWMRNHSWFAVWNERMESFYAATAIVRRNHYMHRLIAAHVHGELERGVEVDHRSRDILDNTRDNLRLATIGQNRANSRKKSYRGQPSSQYKGVSFRKQTGKWRAIIVKNKKQRELGSFDDEKDAARAYNRAAIELHGEFARINEGI